MPVARDSFNNSGDDARPSRGGFYRRADDAPYVSDPSGALVKSGTRKGLPKRVLYGSPSNRGKLIENSTNLTKWGERRVVLGLGVNRELIDDCSKLALLDIDSDEYKTLADSIVMRAKDAAEANLAADRGTHVHALTEDHDTERDWVLRAAAGEVLGIPAEIQRQAVEAWATFLDEHGLEVLATEASCVDDAWRLAGTLDRIVRCTKALRFRMLTGEIVTIPAGTVVVGDVKTSNKRLDSDGMVGFWHAYSIQIASYAQSVPYDTAAETRGVWPFEIDQTHALILRPNVVEVLAGEAETVAWELLYVDLVAGREHGGRCVAEAKAWEQRRDIFSVAQLADDTIAAPAAATIEPPEMSAPSPEAEHADTAGIATEPAPSFSPDVEQQAAAAPEAAAAALSPLRQAQADRKRANDEADAKRRLYAEPEEGTVSDAHSFLVLQKEHEKLTPDQRAWIGRLGEEAVAANVPFGSRNVKTARRFEILRALVALAARSESDEDVRGWLSLIIGDVAKFANVPLGQAVGSLSAVEAATFAGLVRGDLVVRFDDTGTQQLVAA